MDEISVETMVPIGWVLLSFVLVIIGVIALRRGEVFWARRIVYTALVMFGLSTGALFYQGCRYLYINL